MYRIALVQNQSEMAHYAHADARKLMESLGYRVELFTAENAPLLGERLREPEIDAVVLGSNALNDQVIRDAFATDRVVAGMEALLCRGGGLLVLHQQRLATSEDGGFDFLPAPFDQVRSIARPGSERASTGELQFPKVASNHVARLFPNSLRARDIERTALGAPSISGLYWHHWNDPKLSEWDVLLEDSAPGDGRPLILVSKETARHRIVLTALPIDWQGQTELLANLLVYAATGRRSTAILRKSGGGSSTFDYFVESMEARRHPFESYCAHAPGDISRLSRLISEGVHGTLVLLDGLEVSDFAEGDLGSVVHDQAERGALKLVTIRRDSENLPEFTVNSREAYASRLLAVAELTIQNQLRIGNTDGSFWSSIECLQALDAMPETNGSYEPIVGPVLKLADEHDRDGSYDEVFGATCALYWLRARFLGEDHPQTQVSLSWLRERISQHMSRDRAFAYAVLAERGSLTRDEKSRALDDLDSIHLSEHSEIDLCVFLRCALLLGSQKCDEITDALIELQDNGVWIDIATTAATASVLLDYVIHRLQTIDLDDLQRERESVRAAIIAIQDALPSPTELTALPWDNKASTTLRCLEVWLKFDRQIDLPVYEVMDQLAGFDLVSRELATMRSSLSVLGELSDENAALTLRLQSSEKLAAEATKERVGKRLSILLCLALAYVLVCILVAATQVQTEGLASLLDQAFVSPVAFHLAVLAAIGALVVVPWGRMLGRLERA